MIQRKVATQAGSDYFGLPIGSQITEDAQNAAKGRKRPVTMERLMSLRRQFVGAKRAGSKPIMAAVNKQFSEEIKVFAEIEGRSIGSILDEMDASTNKGFSDSTENNDTDVKDGNKKPSDSTTDPGVTEGTDQGAPAGSAA